MGSSFKVLIVRYVKGVYSHNNENILTFIIVLKYCVYQIPLSVLQSVFCQFN